MNKSTFGSPAQYKMLEFLTEKISELSRSPKGYMMKFITNFNKIIKEVRTTEDVELRNYLVNLIRNDYNSKIDNFIFEYDINIITYLKNYIHARTKISTRIHS